MKKKVLFGVTALILVALVVPLVTACPSTPAAPAKDKIVVGMSRSLSGPIAIIGDSAFRVIYETWVPEVNAAGGVYLSEYGKKLPIEEIIYDDKSDVGTMTRLTEKLILEDKVDFLWPACGTSFIFGQAPIANKYGYVLITAEGGATTLKDSLYSLPYSFIVLSFSDWYELPVLADMWSKAGVKSAYVTYIADLHGIENSGVAGKEFAGVGIKILGNVSLPPDLKDFAPVVMDAMASGADAFCCFGYPDQVLPMTGTMIALGYNPKAVVMGPGANFGFYHTAFGPAVEGVTGFTTYARGETPALDALADKLYNGKPEELQDWWGHSLYWAALDVWKAAVEKVGKVDQKALRDTLATTTLDTVLGPTYFTMFGDGGGILAYQCHAGEIGQWQNGVYEVVGGNKPTATYEFPKPAWPK
jgi:branched-chain amino acid transport system substrate-binding protein